MPQPDSKAQSTRTFPRLETFLQDVRYSLRGVRRGPGYSAVVVLTLALGIGATAAIFSIVYAVLLRPLPYPHGERLVWLAESTSKAQGISVTWVNFEHWRDANHNFDEMAGFQGSQLSLTGRGEPLLTRAGLVTSSFFHLTGLRPILGRIFDRNDDRPGAPPAVVLSHTFWAKQLRGDPNIVGAILSLNGRPSEVIGVLAPGAEFFSKPVDLYLSLGALQSVTPQRSQHGSMRALGKLKPGVTLRTALDDLNLIMQRLAETDPGPENLHRAYGEYLAVRTTHQIRPTLLALFGAVAMVLLLATANVASLTLARSTQRAREMAIRASIGAGQMRLARQLLTENVLIAALGGVLALFLAYAGLRLILHAAPPDIPRLSEVRLDWHVLVFAAAVTLFTGILVGFAPVLFTGKLDLLTALNDDSRSATGARRGQSLRSILVIAEIAITLVLFFSAGLLLRSLLRATSGNPGFDSRQLLALQLALPAARYHDPQSRESFFETLMAKIRALPAVTQVSTVNCPPSSGDCFSDWFYSIVGAPVPPAGDMPISLFNLADPGYFSTMQISIRQGRAFTSADRRGTPAVAIVNETFARKWWPPSQSLRAPIAIGHLIKSGGPYMAGPVYQIVGVVGDVSQMGLDSDPLPEIYLPFAQSAAPAMSIMVRAKSNPELLIPGIRHEVERLDPLLPVQSLQPFTQTLAATLERRRFTTLLFSMFALLATVLAAVGVYGLLNYWVTVRENDIAIRLALGAQRAAILRLVGLRALGFTAAGIALGALGAAWASRWIASLLFDTSVHNPSALLASSAALALLCFSAALVPLARAARLDVLDKLRRA